MVSKGGFRWFQKARCADASPRPSGVGRSSGGRTGGRGDRITHARVIPRNDMKNLKWHAHLSSSGNLCRTVGRCITTYPSHRSHALAAHPRCSAAPRAPTDPPSGTRSDLTEPPSALPPTTGRARAGGERRVCTRGAASRLQLVARLPGVMTSFLKPQGSRGVYSPAWAAV